jgi:hypothetical protein
MGARARKIKSRRENPKEEKIIDYQDAEFSMHRPSRDEFRRCSLIAFPPLVPGRRPPKGAIVKALPPPASRRLELGRIENNRSRHARDACREGVGDQNAIFLTR